MAVGQASFIFWTMGGWQSPWTAGGVAVLRVEGEQIPEGGGYGALHRLGRGGLGGAWSSGGRVTPSRWASGRRVLPADLRISGGVLARTARASRVHSRGWSCEAWAAAWWPRVITSEAQRRGI